MAFHSRLETLGKLRRSTEHQAELLLLEINQQISALENAIAAIKAAKRNLRDRPVHATKDFLAGSELHFDEYCVSALQAREQGLRNQLSAAICTRELRKQAFHQARQEREAVETLINHQRETYVKEESRRQQRRIDDMFLLQSRFQRR